MTEFKHFNNYNGVIRLSNIILTNISRMRKGFPFQNYHTDDMEIIRGRYTNEAPVKYLLNSIYKGVSGADCTIIAITTPEAQEAFIAFRKTIRRYCKRNNYSNLSIESITYDKNFGTVIAEIINMVKKEDRVYIDTTGGFRDSVYILMASVRILEYSGVKLEKAVYSVLNNFKPPKKSQDVSPEFPKKKVKKHNRIDDITATYNMFNLINAANSFTSFGNAEELTDFFAESHNSEIKKAIDVMKRFSNEVALCRTSNLNDLICELNEILTNIQTMDTDDESEILFKSISGVIREKLGASAREEIDCLDIITWCLDNRMIQQAVTIYVERIPEYLFGSKILVYNPKKVNTADFRKDFDIYYNLLYNGFLKLTTSITLSKYPVGNLLLRLKRDNLIIYREICSINSINDLSIKEQLTQDEWRGILNLIRVKNVLFSEPGIRRTAEETESKRQKNKLRDFAESDIFETAAPNTEAFVNGLLKENEYIHLLQGECAPYNPRVWGVADINVVEHLERVLSENNDMYSVRSHVDLNDVKELLRHLIYVKRYIRNALNHASEERHIADEYDEYFGGMGYNVSTELSVKEIEFVIRKAVNLIRKITE